MENDKLANQVNAELEQLQSTLKDRLVEVQDVGDLEKSVLSSSLEIEQRTSSLEKTSRKVKWKWYLEYIKWTLIAGSIVVILFLIFIKTFWK